MQKTDRDDTREPSERELPERDARILDFEARSWPHAGAKEEAIRVELGLSAARYYQLLNAVIDTPAAIRRDPMLSNRVRGMRENRLRGATPGPDARS